MDKYLKRALIDSYREMARSLLDMAQEELDHPDTNHLLFHRILREAYKANSIAKKLGGDYTVTNIEELLEEAL